MRAPVGPRWLFGPIQIGQSSRRRRRVEQRRSLHVLGRERHHPALNGSGVWARLQAVSGGSHGEISVA